MIYVIGVDHLIQYKNGIVPEKVFIEFTDYLTAKTRELGISLVAEEFSEEALYEVYASETATAKEAAGKTGTEHRFCDPEDTDRKKMGIPYFADIKDSIKRKYNIRERILPDNGLRKKINSESAEVSKAFWKLREEFWFSRISDCLDRNIIFICGHEHTERFRALLESKGVKCVILELFWRKELFGDYDRLFSMGNQSNT